MRIDAQHDRSLHELHRTRAALRAEMNRILHWRRLIKARIDLSVATALLPERIGQESVSPLLLDYPDTLPTHEVLAQLVRGSSTTSDVFQLGELRRIERELLDYGDTVRRSLEYTTERLVFRLTQDPFSAIAQQAAIS